jgi:hypothetical protein
VLASDEFADARPATGAISSRFRLIACHFFCLAGAMIIYQPTVVQ